MRILALDPRSGDYFSNLFVLDERGRHLRKLRLGYVPELRYDSARRELAVVETRIPYGLFRRRVSYWLKRYDSDSFRLLGQVETPERPMYAGYPNRSTRVAESRSGHYLYFLSQQILLRGNGTGDVFRLRPHRLDRRTGTVAQGSFVIDSCMVEFGQIGDHDDDLYFHLSCDFPSTVAFAKFLCADVEMVQMVDLRPRVHCPQETNGSWLDRSSNCLYCVSGDGSIYEVKHPPHPHCRLVTKAELQTGQSIGLQMLHGAGDDLFLGICANPGERSLSLASQVQIFSKNGRYRKTVDLPFPAINFVATEDGDRLVAVSPYDRALAIVDVGSGNVMQVIGQLGFTPAEVLLLP